MKYASSIFVHGLLVPGLVLVVLTGAGTIGWSKFKAEVDRKRQIYETQKSNEATANELAAKVRPFVPRLLLWKGITSGDQYEQIGDALVKLEGESQRSQLARERFRKESVAVPFSPDIKCPAEIYTLGFRGRYGALHAATLSLETHRPNMMLTQMSIVARLAEGSHTLLSADCSYTVFTAE